jgi:hypothetical protein
MSIRIRLNIGCLKTKVALANNAKQPSVFLNGSAMNAGLTAANVKCVVGKEEHSEAPQDRFFQGGCGVRKGECHRKKSMMPETPKVIVMVRAIRLGLMWRYQISEARITITRAASQRHGTGRLLKTKMPAA